MARAERRAAGVVVRPMTEADLDDVMAIERASFTMPWTRDTFQGLVRRTDTVMIVAEPDPAPEAAPALAGYAAVWIVLDQAELGDIAVAQAWRGRGVGRLLLEEVLAAATRRGVRELYLEVRVSNQEALGLYRRYGFEEVGRRRDYYVRPREDALVMRRPLG